MTQSLAFPDASECQPHELAATALRRPVQPAPAASLLPRPQSDDLGPNARRLLTGGVLAAHVLGAWGLLQIDAVRQAVVEAAPIMVSMIAPAEAPKPPTPAPPPPAPQPKKVQPAPAPLIVAAPSPAPAPLSFVAPAPEPAPPVVVAVAPAPPAPPIAPAPPAPPAIKQIPPSAVRYLVEPKMSVPLLSRRLGESGMVHLRIVVDAQGFLKEASVKKSSGFARLDQQALLEIRTARFAPQMEMGKPVEWETTALMSYELQ